MDIKLEKHRREPRVGNVYLYDAKHYVVVSSSISFSFMDLVTMEVSRYWFNDIEDIVQIRDGEYVGTLKITI